MHCRRFTLWLLPRRRMVHATATTLLTSTIRVFVRHFLLSFLAFDRLHPARQLRRIASVCGACFSISLTTAWTFNLCNMPWLRLRRMESVFVEHIAFISSAILLPSKSTIRSRIRESLMAWRAIDLLFLLPTFLPRRFKEFVSGKIRDEVALLTQT